MSRILESLWTILNGLVGWCAGCPAAAWFQIFISIRTWWSPVIYTAQFLKKETRNSLTRSRPTGRRWLGEPAGQIFVRQKVFHSSCVDAYLTRDWTGQWAGSQRTAHNTHALINVSVCVWWGERERERERRKIIRDMKTWGCECGQLTYLLQTQLSVTRLGG